LYNLPDIYRIAILGLGHSNIISKEPKMLLLPSIVSLALGTYLANALPNAQLELNHPPPNLAGSESSPSEDDPSSAEKRAA
jgi:hypothetical protein